MVWAIQDFRKPLGVAVVAAQDADFEHGRTSNNCQLSMVN
jgi:hypothetical protein